jgi:hypothetical protein
MSGRHPASSSRPHCPARAAALSYVAVPTYSTLGAALPVKRTTSAHTPGSFMPSLPLPTNTPLTERKRFIV